MAPLFVLDPKLLAVAGDRRIAFMIALLRALERDLAPRGAHLIVRRGDPATVVPALARELAAREVVVTEDFGPYGRVRDGRVAMALGRIPLRAVGTPYALAPGALRTAGGGAYQVFGAFYRAWQRHGWESPVACDLSGVAWQGAPGEPIPLGPPVAGGLELLPAGEHAARARLERFIADALGEYEKNRELPAMSGTSGLSPYLKFGAIHPRTVLAATRGAPDDRFRRQLAWREFYADVLFADPSTARCPLHPELAGLAGPGETAHLEAWKAGMTGYPIIDAGMRQLAREGFMHNRVRMLVASFLLKDLHHDWQVGARHFMVQLVDGDLASNQHNWQWVAGTGTDAAPYFRVFNPTVQAKRFDPEGRYVRRFVEELAQLPDALVHEPWRAGIPAGYLLPIVDHHQERERALAAYRERRRQGSGSRRRGA